jgi:hypothetical protein
VLLVRVPELEPWWGKPFGVETPERDWLISTGGRPRKQPKLKKYGGEFERKLYSAARKRRDLRWKYEKKPFAIEPTVRVKCYAHDRIVITAYDAVPPVLTERDDIGLSCSEIIAGAARLV